ncbi:MAG: response regulator [Candidatus Omnitrophica bacterium]|nr:response regulator [Candidatus Omnitrophota bacterium]
MAKKKILAIDDNTRFLELLKLNLEATGNYEVRTDSRGSYTLADVLVFLPDLILLDFVMDDLDGFDVASELKKHEFTKNIPIVFLTGAFKKEDEVNKKLGYDCPIVYKPLFLDELVATIEETINKNKNK